MSSTQWESIFSMSENHELEKLLEFASYTSHLSNIAIEVGSYQGKTAALLAEHFSIVFAIDLYGNVENGMENYNDIGKINLDIIIENIKQRELIGTVVPVVGPSTILENFQGMNPGLIFVDGAHDYGNIKMDLLNASDVIVDNGIVVAHDYKRPGWGYPPYDRGKYDPWHGVVEAVDELIDKGIYKIHEHYAGIVALKVRRR